MLSRYSDEKLAARKAMLVSWIETRKHLKEVRQQTRGMSVAARPTVNLQAISRRGKPSASRIQASHMHAVPELY